MNNENKLLRNSARCRVCGTELISRHRHDFVVCPCFTNSNGKRGIFIDGGLSYQRSGGDPVDFEDTSLWENNENEV